MWYAVTFILGFVSCLIALYALGTRRHSGHKAASGPTSKTQTKENIVTVLSRG